MTGITSSNINQKTGYEYGFLTDIPSLLVGAIAAVALQRFQLVSSGLQTAAVAAGSALLAYESSGSIPCWGDKPLLNFWTDVPSLSMGAVTAFALQYFGVTSTVLQTAVIGGGVAVSTYAALNSRDKIEPKEKPLRDLSDKVNRFKSESGIALKPEKGLLEEKTERKASVGADKTDEKLKELTCNVQLYLTFLYLSTNVLPFFSNKRMEEAGFHQEIMELAAKAAKMKDQRPIDVYIAHLHQKNKANLYNPLTLLCEWGTRFRHFCVYRLIYAKTRIAFEKIMRETRESTDGRIQSIFEGVLGHVNKFLTEYNKGESLSTRINGLEFSDLTQKLAPLLVKGFYPEEDLAAQASKIPVLGFFLDLPSQILDYLLNQFGQAALKYYLPEVLKTLSDSIVDPTLVDSNNQQNLVNFPFAIPLTQAVNRQLDQFLHLLDKSSSQIEQPLSPGTEEELTGVVTQIMTLADISGDKDVVEGIRGGLVRGVDALKEYLKEEPETALLELVSLANTPFEKSELPTTDADCLAKYKSLKQKQKDLVEAICDKIFGQEVQKAITGISEAAIRGHAGRSTHELKALIDKSLFNRSLLRAEMVQAREKFEFQEYLQALNKQMMTWYEFTQKLEAATAKHNPQVAREELLRKFSPICEVGKEQIEVFEDLQNSWVAYQRLSEVAKGIGHLENDLTKSDDFLKIVEKLKDIQGFKDNIALQGLLSKIREIEDLREVHKKQVEFRERLISFSPQPDKIEQIQAILEKNLVEDSEILRKMEVLRRLSLAGDSKATQIKCDIIDAIKTLVLDQNRKLKSKQDSLFRSLNIREIPREELGTKALMSKCCIWMKECIEDCKRKHLEELENGHKQLEILERRVKKYKDKIGSTSLAFPLEHSILTPIVISVGEKLKKRSKEDLKTSFLRILDKVGGLLTTKTDNKDKNLYSWVERVAFYEIIQHLKNKYN